MFAPARRESISKEEEEEKLLQFSFSLENGENFSFSFFYLISFQPLSIVLLRESSTLSASLSSHFKLFFT